MKDLTDAQILEVAGNDRGPIKAARSIIAADRALNAPADRDVMRQMVNELLHQIDIGDFVDSHGHSAKMLKPVHDLMRMLAAAPTPPAEPQTAINVPPQFASDVLRLMHLASIGGPSAPNDNGEYVRLVAAIRAVLRPYGQQISRIA